MSRRESDLIVVGAGVVGLATALAAERAGLAVSLLDQHAIESHYSPVNIDRRIYAIAPASSAWLAQLGAWPGVLARRAQPYQRMVVWDALSKAELCFDAAELARPELGHIVEESALRAGLLDALATTSVELIGAAAIESVDAGPGRVRIALADQRQVRGKLLVAADGARSHLRSLLGVESSAAAFGQTALVASLECSSPHQNTAWQRFQPGGPLALLPLANGEVSMVFSVPTERLSALLAMSAEQVSSVVTRASDQRLGELNLSSALHSFPLERHLAQRLLGPGFVLVGDAARTVHPLAGLGLNLGLADAMALLDTIGALKEAGRDWTTVAALRPFERVRMSESALISASLGAINALFRRADPPLALARSQAMAMVNQSELLKRFFAERSLKVRFGALA